MAAPELVEFPKTNLTDIPAKLRQMADWIEAGEFGEVTLCIVALERKADPGFIGSAAVHGFGKYTTADAYYLMARAMRLVDTANGDE